MAVNYAAIIYQKGISSLPLINEEAIRLVASTVDCTKQYNMNRDVLDGHHLELKIDLQTDNTTANNYLKVMLEFDADVTTTQKDNETPSTSGNTATIQFLLPTTSATAFEGCVFKIAGVKELRKMTLDIKDIEDKISVTINSISLQYSKFWDDKDLYNISVDSGA